MDDKELKVKSIRADDDTYEKFKKLATNEFGNQGQCLTALINIYETETSKVALVERKMEIESFQDYLNKIGGLFISSLQLNNDAEGRIRDEFARQIISKDKTIEDLQNKINKSESDKNTIKEAYNDTIAKNEDSLKRNIELAESNNTFKSLVEEYKSKNDTLTGLLGKYEKFPEQLAKAQTENLENISNLKEKNSSISNLTNEIKNLKNNKKIEIDNLIEDHTQALESAVSKENFNADKLLLSKDKDYQSIINKLNTDSNNKINSLLNEKGKVNEKISKLMEENQIKDREINSMDMKIKGLEIKVENYGINNLDINNLASEEYKK